MDTLLRAFAVDVARAAVWFFLLCIVFVPLERGFAERRQPVLRRQFAVDTGYYFINSVVTVGAVASLMALLAVGLRWLVPDALLAATASLKLWALIPATLLVSEFGSYWGHRWSHEIPLLWRFHSIHHSAEQVDWLTNTRGHPVDIVVTRLCGLLPVYLLGLAQPGIGAGSIVAALVTVFAIFWGFFIHANLKWRFGWLEAVIATPAFHRWHHTNDTHRDHNYAATLPFYDRLFGSLHLPDNPPPIYGIDAPMPAGLLAQLFRPFAR